MIPAFYAEANTIVKALATARAKIETINNSDFFPVRNRMINQLNGMINKVRFQQLGLDPIEFEQPSDGLPTETESTGPLTKLFGQEITSPK
jgi:hypothetical protein